MKIKKLLFVLAGFICIGLGTIGIFMPLLPTTPLYLLAALCFAKGSARFHNWFTGTRLYKKHLESFVETRSMTLKTKLSILIPVTLLLLVTGFFMDVLVMRIIIGVLLAAKYLYFIFAIKTVDGVRLIRKDT